MAALDIDPALRTFVADELLPGLDLDADHFWDALTSLHQRFAGRITELLARRDELQQRIDAWHTERGGAGDPAEYEQFLTEIGYLLPVEQPQIDVDGVDAEIATIAGPQLVVPSTVPRYALNAANARWGSLYDALYGTDALPQTRQLAPGYDEERGAEVIAEADRLLDELFPLASGSHADASDYTVHNGTLVVVTASGETGLADSDQFAGIEGGRPAARPQRAARRAARRPRAPHRPPAPRRHRRRRAGVGGHRDRRPRGLRRHGRRRGQDERLPHLARPDDRRRSPPRSRRVGRPSSAPCTATASGPRPTARR